ncbi:MAG: hypothetical protein JXQ27_04680 [Acidobacteria bacterium]|nr:hypothetical protein [Acidobacteriota bacterium]
MAKRFVDLFDVRTEGINFLAAVGLILAVIPAKLLSYLYYYFLLVTENIPEEILSQVTSPPALVSSLSRYVLFAVMFMVLVHVLRRDWPVPLLMTVVFFIYDIVFWMWVRPALFSGDDPSMAMSFDWHLVLNFTSEALLLTSAWILFYRLSRRPGVALLLGAFAAGILQGILHGCIYWFPRLFEDYYSFEFKDLLDPALSALYWMLPWVAGAGLFWAGYWLHHLLRRRPSAALTRDYTPSRRISRGGFYGSLSILVTLNVLLAIVELAFLRVGQDQSELLLVAFLAVGGMLLVTMVAVVLVPILFYKIWDNLPSDQRRMSPGQAVGFLFIPFFNVYWIFQVLAGFARDYNRLLQRLDLERPRLSAGWMITYCILVLLLGGLSFIPMVGLPLAILLQAFVLVTISMLIDAVNALPDPLPLPPIEAVPDLAPIPPVP